MTTRFDARVPECSLVEDRFWEFRLGQGGITIRKHARRYVAPAPIAERQADARPGWLGKVRAIWILPAVLASGSVTAMAARPASESSAGRYAVVIPVPEVKHTVADAPPVRITRAAPTRRPLGKTPSPLPAADRLDANIARAMRTGEMQSWETPDGAHHYVIPGLADAQGAPGCRDIAVLVRAFGSPDDVQHFNRCP